MSFVTPQPDAVTDPDAGARSPWSIPVPFLNAPTPLGDAVSRLTAVFGARPCGGYARRAEALNRRAVLTPWGNR